MGPIYGTRTKMKSEHQKIVKMTAAQIYRTTFAGKPLERLFLTEFYIWDEAIERWKKEGLTEDATKQRDVFLFDEDVTISTGLNLGWCEPPLLPTRLVGKSQVEIDFWVNQGASGAMTGLPAYFSQR